MNLKRFTVNPFQENTYLIYKNDHAILIDPGFSSKHEFAELDSFLSENNLTLDAIYLTHAHIDHVIGLQSVVDQYGVEVYLHPEDQFFIDNYVEQAARFGVKVEPITATVHPLKEETWTWQGSTIHNLFTPGHAPGHLSFYVAEKEFVIAGDTLFHQSIGRTDLYKGDFDMLAESIRTKLYTLPEDTHVFPGHGPETTIGFEMKNNPFVKSE